MEGITRIKFMKIPAEETIQETAIGLREMRMTNVALHMGDVTDNP